MTEHPSLFVESGLKTCRRCGEAKPLSDFPRRGPKERGVREKCRPCAQAYLVEWWQKSGRRRADYARKYNYGITPERFAEMVSAQAGVCAICLMPPSGVGRVGKVLHVDHDHDTGIVRGLLCNRCNRTIGLMGENVGVLRAAINYLDKHKQRQVQ